MATVNFYLKEPESNEETQVFLNFYCTSFRIKFSTGEKIYAKHWNPKTKRAKKNFEGASEFNQFLDKLQEEAKRIHRNSLNVGTPLTGDDLKGKLMLLTGKVIPGVKLSFYDAFRQYLEIKKGKYSANYLKGTNTLLNHLLNFEKEKKMKVTFSEINFAFYEKFTAYLYNDCKQLDNTVGTNISRLKNFLNWATAMKYNSSTHYKDKEFKAIESETDIVYLTMEELIRLYELDLKGKKKLNNVRESFCFGCFTGLRFSDISAIRPENIKGDELVLVTQKTKDQISISLNDYAISILERNEYRLPVISNQKTNDYLKELCQLAEIADPVKITKFRGVERVEIVEPKYNFITSHTARRTFVTLSLEQGMRAETVMAFTGHKNHKNFKKYIVLTDKVKKAEMKRIWNREPVQSLKAV